MTGDAGAPEEPLSPGTGDPRAATYPPIPFGTVFDPAAGVRLRRTWGQRLTLFGCALLSVVSLSTALSLAYVDSKANRLQRVTLGDVLSSTTGASNRPTITAAGTLSSWALSSGSRSSGSRSSGARSSGATAAATTGAGSTGSSALPPAGRTDAINVLLVGLDNAEGLPAEDPRRNGRDLGVRSDTMMVLRLDPRTGVAVVLSLPRDLWLPLGAGNGSAKLNAALPLGGPELLIRTIADNFDIAIDHYVAVDFAQFQRMVDAIGGVPMSFDRPARDDNSGLWIGEPGCRTLDGTTALAFVRSRYLQVLDNGTWVADEASDLSRINRQQAFLRRAVSRALAKGGRNPFTLNRLVDIGLSGVTVDTGFAPNDIVELARRFRGLDDDRLFTFGLPVAYDETPEGQSIVRTRRDAAEPVLDIFRGLNPDDPAVVTVRVVGDLSLAQQLRYAGFLADGDTGAPTAATVIRYAAGSRYRAETVAAWLDGVVELQLDDRLTDHTVTVSTGPGLVAVRDTPPDRPSYWPVKGQSSTTAVGVDTADTRCR